MKSINVKGTGVFSKFPDTISIRFTLETISKNYEKTLDKAERDLALLYSTVEALGFSKKELKTENFHIDQTTENVRGDQGEYKVVVTGYKCTHSLNLSFNYDTLLLGKIINAISKSGVSVNFTIGFTVKDTNAAKAELLKNAVLDAKKKAEILAVAAGVTLGEIETINYNFDNNRFMSDTNYAPAPRAMMARAFDIEPQDVTQTDYVNITFGIK